MSKLLYGLAAMAVAAGLLLVPGISEHKAGKAEKSVSVPEQIPTDTTDKYSDTGSGAVSGAGTPGPIDTTDEYSSCISEIRSELERLNVKHMSLSGYSCEDYHKFTIDGKPFIVLGKTERVEKLKRSILELKDVCKGAFDLFPEEEPTILYIKDADFSHAGRKVKVIANHDIDQAPSNLSIFSTVVHERSHFWFPSKVAEIYLKIIGEKTDPFTYPDNFVDPEDVLQGHPRLQPFCSFWGEVKYVNVTIDNKTGRVPVVETGIMAETTEEYLRRIGVDKLSAGDEEGFVKRLREELLRSHINVTHKYESPPSNITVDVTEDVEKLREDFPWILDSLKYINTTEVK